MDMKKLLALSITTAVSLIAATAHAASPAAAGIAAPIGAESAYGASLHRAPRLDPIGATNHRTSFAPGAAVAAAAARSLPGTADAMLVFSAPPRETVEESHKLYQPVAEYLSRITGKQIVYRHPGNWLSYQTEMLKGSYDLVFDGPHLNAWRMNHLQHNALARIADEHAFAVIVRKDNATIQDVKQLAGQRVCGMNPPNLGTLAVQSQFDNPMRQPLIVDTVGWNKVYEGVVMDKRCTAGIIPVGNLKRLDLAGSLARVVYQTRMLPNQAFSAGPRVTREDQAKIARALVSPEGDSATAALRAANGTDKGLTTATREEYAGLDSYLKDIWGYSR